MRRVMRVMLLWAGLCSAGSCGLEPMFTDLPIETNLAFTNLSTRFYATLRIRVSADGSGAYSQTSLLAPGSTHRVRFLDLLGTGCPEAVDLQVLLYRRVNEDVPIGLDAAEAVESAPVVAGEVLNIPACGVQELESFTVVNWEAAEGTGRVKIAQNTPVDEAIRASGIFPNADADGRFVLDRPPGGYQIEAFSDAFSFRPAFSLLETPVESFVIVAEPL